MEEASQAFRKGSFAEAALLFEECAAASKHGSDALRCWSNAAACWVQLRDFDSAITACTIGLQQAPIIESDENRILEVKCRLRRAQSLLAVAESRGLACASAAADEAAFCRDQGMASGGNIAQRANQIFQDANCLIRERSQVPSARIAASAEAGLKEYSATGAGELLTASHSLRLQCRATHRPFDSTLCLSVTCANEFGLFSEQLFASRLASAGRAATDGHVVSLEPTVWEGLPAIAWQDLIDDGPPCTFASSDSHARVAQWLSATLHVAADPVAAALHGVIQPRPAAHMDSHGRAFMTARTAQIDEAPAGLWLAPVCLRLRLAAGGDVAAPVLSPPLAWCCKTGELRPMPPQCMSHLLSSEAQGGDVGRSASSACSRLFQLQLLAAGTPTAPARNLAVEVTLSEHYGELGIAGRNWDAGIATACLLGRLAAKGALLSGRHSGQDSSTQQTIIELGAGTGLTGIILARLWEGVGQLGRPMPALEVCLTDVDAAVPAMNFNLRLNKLHHSTQSQVFTGIDSAASANSSSASEVKVRAAALFWGRDSVESVIGPNCMHTTTKLDGGSTLCGDTLRWNTLVLMTDVVYDEEVYSGLVAACREACGIVKAAATEERAGELRGTKPPSFEHSCLSCLPPLLCSVYGALQGAGVKLQSSALTETQWACRSLERAAAMGQGRGAVPWILLGYRPRHESAVQWWGDMLLSFHAVRVWHAGAAHPDNGAAPTNGNAQEQEPEEASIPSLPHDSVLDTPWLCDTAHDAVDDASLQFELTLPHWCETIVSRGSDLSLFVLFPRL